MQELYIGMPLLDIIDLLEKINIQESFKNNILNFCRQELQFGDSKISNEIELAMLKAWINNSDKINMPELLSDKYKLIDVYTENKESETKTFEEFLAYDNTYYLRCITRNADNIVTKVSLSHKNVSFMEMIKNGGTEDIITDCNNDGYANSRTIIKKQSNNVDIINDINMDGKKD